MYLVYMQRGFTGGECLRSEWARNETPGYDTMRRGLEMLYPGRRIYTPLEQATGRYFLVTCYLSDDRYGRGRRGSQFFEWAVEGEPHEVLDAQANVWAAGYSPKSLRSFLENDGDFGAGRDEALRLARRRACQRLLDQREGVQGG